MISLIRKTKNRLFGGLMILMGSISLFLLLAGFGCIFFQGFHHLSWSFLVQPMKEGGLSGGIFYQLLGTLILMGTTLLITTPLAFGSAIMRSFYLSQPHMKKLFALFLYVLNGIPSVLFGIFGFFFFVKFLGWGKSWFSGGILLAVMILPTVSLALSEGMERIPRSYIENAKALGLNGTQRLFSIVIPQSFSSFLSGLLLGLARAAGETAPIMFTAVVFSGAVFPEGVTQSPVLALPYHIFNLAQESYQANALENAWTSALVLVGLVFGCSLLALPFRMKFHEEARYS